MKNEYEVIDKDGLITIKNQFGQDVEVPVKAGTVIIYANGYGRKWEIFIDQEDLEKVDQAADGRWYISIKKDTIYASFCKQKDNIRNYVHMHRLIADCPEGLVVDHYHHHYGLDNRRYNLKVVTAEENNRNQIKSRTDKFKPQAIENDHRLLTHIIESYFHDNHVFEGLTEEQMAKVKSLIPVNNEIAYDIVINFRIEDQLKIENLINQIPAEADQELVTKIMYEHYLKQLLNMGFINAGLNIKQSSDEVKQRYQAIISEDYDTFHDNADFSTYNDYKIKEQCVAEHKLCRVNFILDNILSPYLQKAINLFFTTRNFITYFAYTQDVCLKSYRDFGGNKMDAGHDYMSFSGEKSKEEIMKLSKK